jgi:lactoylglutathione lyase
MKPDDLYHTGIVVDDLDATLQWFTAVAGYRWTDVVEVDQMVATPEGEVTVPMRMAYSGEDPRVEILQTIPNTIWTPADSGVHHLGYWSDDVDADVVALEANGMTVEVKSLLPEGTTLWAYCKGATGPRIELVSRAMEPFIAHWFATADAST